MKNFYVPATTLDYCQEKQYPDKYLWVIHKLYSYENRASIPGSYKLLKAEYLKNILGRYKPVLNDLINDGIIETDNQYFVGKISKGYRLSEEYKYSPYIRVPLDLSSPSLVNYINNINTNYYPSRVFLGEVTYPNTYQTLYDSPNVNLMLTKVTTNLFNVLSQSSLSKESRDYATQYLNSISADFKPKQYIAKQLAYEMSIDKIEQQDFYLVQDPKTGRVFTNITNLPGKLRQFLKINGIGNLIEIDLITSQPFLLNGLIDKALRNNPDVKKYREITTEADIYNYLADRLGFTRSYAKEKMIKTVLFGKIKDYNLKSDIVKIFKCEFPTVWDVILKYKKEDYTQLALALQKQEADLMINKVAIELFNQNTQFFTVHDSIISNVFNKELIIKTINDVYSKELHLLPQLKIK
ncbi:MAG: hypothetical protein IAE93_05980 [Ignavibacteria bacterium]|nr:hypothetical protein [Ignavibacteria bacterium]